MRPVPLRRLRTIWAIMLPLVLCQCYPIVALFGGRGAVGPLQSGETVDRDAALVLVGFEQQDDDSVSQSFGRIDPATGEPIGNCWYWDHFTFQAPAGTGKRRMYRLFEVPAGTYASLLHGHKKRYADRWDAREWVVDAVSGQVSYFGDLVVDAHGVIDIEWDEGRAAAALRLDFPKIGLPLTDRRPVRTTAQVLMMKCVL